VGRPRRRSRSTPFLSRISTRLLAFNLLVLFLPVGAFLYLDTYERQLLRALEHALVQQGRVLAAALAGGDEPLDAGAAARVLVRLERRHEARLRVVDAAGRLLADSSRLASLREPAATLEPPQEPGPATPEAKAPEPAGNRGTSTADAEPKGPGTPPVPSCTGQPLHRFGCTAGSSAPRSLRWTRRSST
jgi:hypothetical protein